MQLKESVENNRKLEHLIKNGDAQIQLIHHDFLLVPSNGPSISDLDDHEYCQITPTVEVSSGYRFNFDNLDFLIRVRDMIRRGACKLLELVSNPFV